MAKDDVYKELVEMINREDPHVVGVPVTPAFLKVLSLLFTPEEAKLALQIGLTGGTLDEVIDEARLTPEWIKKGVERFVADRKDRLARLRAELDAVR